MFQVISAVPGIPLSRASNTLITKLEPHRHHVSVLAHVINNSYRPEDMVGWK